MPDQTCVVQACPVHVVHEMLATGGPDEGAGNCGEDDLFRLRAEDPILCMGMACLRHLSMICWLNELVGLRILSAPDSIHVKSNHVLLDDG